MNTTEEYLDHNTTKAFNESQIMSNYYEYIMYSVIDTVCCMGIPLNGIVIWLLGFQIKKNPFTVLILNLAIADFGFLIVMTVFSIKFFLRFIEPKIAWIIFSSLFKVTYINGLFLLTVISIDRCIAVLFPIWHRCFRPKYLSSVVCAFLWIFSFVLIGIGYIMQFVFLYIWNFHLVLTAVLCLPLITISTVILFIKICLKSQQIKRKRLLVMTLITLLCFLILTLPLYIYVFITYFLKKRLFDVGELNYYLRPSASLNSSINPVIYFLVGRKNRARTRESIKVIFERVFREDEAPEN